MKARLLYGASETCSDILYATKFFAPDEFLWFELNGKSYAVMSPLEIDRGKARACVDCILPLSDFQKKLEEKLNRLPRVEEIILEVLVEYHIKGIEVPFYFSVHYADFLRKNGFEVEICEGEFFPERQIKSAEEIRNITRALRIAEKGLNRGIEILRASKIAKNKTLKWGQATLTSGVLRGEIDATITKLGGLPRGTIVACGEQGCDPHEVGHGNLKANESIVIDVFPRDQRTGYFGDLTRTVVKGKASDALKKLYRTVQEGQNFILHSMKAGADGMKLHKELHRFFEKRGYKTEQKRGRWVGFFHGTGHSLGLEIHEPPRFQHGIFCEGHVMTVEPGLYYPEIGGVRLEDLVVVQKNGVKNLTKVKKFLEL